MFANALLMLGALCIATWFAGVAIGLTFDNYIYILLPLGGLLIVSGFVLRLASK